MKDKVELLRITINSKLAPLITINSKLAPLMKCEIFFAVMQITNCIS